jgi:hypothetical protein
VTASGRRKYGNETTSSTARAVRRPRDVPEESHAPGARRASPTVHAAATSTSIAAM